MLPDSEKSLLLRDLAASHCGAQFTCNSGSMEPTIAVGEQVRVFAVTPTCLRVGDVVVCEGAQGYVLHRIVFLAPGLTWFLHLGDAHLENPAIAPQRALVAAIVGRARIRNRPIGSGLPFLLRYLRHRVLGRAYS